MENLVLMITPNAFPNGDAGAVRDLSFAKIYQMLGYTVCHIGQNKEKLQGCFEDVTFFSLYTQASNIPQQFFRFISYKKKLFETIKRIEKKYGQPTVIHLYDSPHGGIEKIKKYASRINAKLIHDSVEWYSPCEFAKGKWDKSYILKDHLNRKLIDTSFRVIGISSYLRNYFEGKGIKSIRIPVIIDTEAGVGQPIHTWNKINIVYAGSPAKKDLLRNILTAYAAVSEKVRSKLFLNVVGVSEQQAIEQKMCTKEEIESIRNNIMFHGRVSRDKVLDVLAVSDFSVLVRPAAERYAMAGYPTKTVEAMANSVAMLCNLSSDLGMYLKDDINAIIIENESVSALCRGFERVSELSKESVLRIRENARDTATEHFDYRKYVKTMKDFLK